MRLVTLMAEYANLNLFLDKKLGFSKSTTIIVLAISLLHVLNFLNYSSLAGLINAPAARAILLSVVLSWALFSNFGALTNYHLKENFDLYAFSFLTLVSVLYSQQANESLLYAAWLFLSLFLLLELSRRVKTIEQIQIVLLVIFVPVLNFPPFNLTQ